MSEQIMGVPSGEGKEPKIIGRRAFIDGLARGAAVGVVGGFVGAKITGPAISDSGKIELRRELEERKQLARYDMEFERISNSFSVPDGVRGFMNAFNEASKTNFSSTPDVGIGPFGPNDSSREKVDPFIQYAMAFGAIRTNMELSSLEEIDAQKEYARLKIKYSSGSPLVGEDNHSHLVMDDDSIRTQNLVGGKMMDVMTVMRNWIDRKQEFEQLFAKFLEIAEKRKSVAK